MQSTIIQTSDGYGIHTHIFSPKHSNGKLLLINSATGVKQQMYFAFAQYMCDHGFTVLTYDYRGIGLSKPKRLKGFEASMRMWGTHDYKSLTTYIQNHYPHYTYYCLGHSVGALILGMNADSIIFEKFVFIATQNTYLNHLNWQTQVLGYFAFGILQPVSSKILGYFPAQYLGLGESLPKGSASDWRKLVLNKKSTNRLLEEVEDFSKSLNQNTLMIRLEDDLWVTEKGVKHLFKDTYSNIKVQHRLILVSESEVGKIGHIDYFRSFNSKLWSIILQYLE